MRVSLTKALQKGRQEDFIAQEEARGIGPINEAKFIEAASKVIKTPPRSDQTSGSPHLGGSPEK